jgi:hypothetical protein
VPILVDVDVDVDVDVSTGSGVATSSKPFWMGTIESEVTAGVLLSMGNRGISLGGGGVIELGVAVGFRVSNS